MWSFFLCLCVKIFCRRASHFCKNFRLHKKFRLDIPFSEDFYIQTRSIPSQTTTGTNFTHPPHSSPNTKLFLRKRTTISDQRPFQKLHALCCKRKSLQSLLILVFGKKRHFGGGISCLTFCISRMVGELRSGGTHTGNERKAITYYNLDPHQCPTQNLNPRWQ